MLAESRGQNLSMSKALGDINQTQNTSDGVEIVFTTKNYNLLGGLSQLMHTAKQDNTYQVKALLGKGLNLNTNGTHVAFVGGTGVLVFVDLVALLIR